MSLTTCPYCNREGLSKRGLGRHISSCKQRSTKVVEGFTVQATNTLKKYEGASNVREIMKKVQEDLNVVLNDYLSENWMMEKDFPVHFSNEWGDFYVESDGETRWVPHVGLETITVNFTISSHSENFS